MAVRLPCTTFWVGNLQHEPENNPHRGANLGGLFSFIQICEERQQEHAERNHFCKRKLHKHHPRSGGNTSHPSLLHTSIIANAEIVS